MLVICGARRGRYVERQLRFHPRRKWLRCDRCGRRINRFSCVLAIGLFAGWLASITP